MQGSDRECHRLSKRVHNRPKNKMVRAHLAALAHLHNLRARAILSSVEQQELIEKIKRLPPDRVAEVEAFVDSLTREPGLDRNALHQAISEYAIQHMGTAADLDPDLEAAATEQLHNSDKN